jgi:zinc protease
LDYYTKIPQRYSTVTQSELIDMAKKYVPAEKLIVVAVGDKKKIEADLAKLNLGQAEYRDADGVVLKK